MNNEIISLRKEKKLSLSTLTEEIHQIKINKRKNRLFTFFMNHRTKETSPPVTISQIESASDTKSKIDLFFDFFSYHDICDLYQSQIDYITNTLSSLFINILKDQDNIYTYPIKEKVLKIIALLLVENSMFIDSFLQVDFIDDFKFALNKTLNDESVYSQENINVVFSYLVILSNLFYCDEVSIAIVSNSIDINETISKIASKTIYNFNNKVEDRIEIAKVILILIRNIFFNIKKEDYSKFHPLLKLTIQVMKYSLDADVNEILFEAIETLSFINNDYVINEDLLSMTQLLITEHRKYSDDVITDAFHIGCNIFDFAKEKKSKIDLINNEDIINCVFEVLNKSMEEIVKCIDEEISKKDIVIYAVRMISKAIEFNSKIQNEKIEKKLVKLINLNFIDSFSRIFELKQDNDINTEILYFYINIFETEFFSLQNELTFTYHFYKFYAKNVKNDTNTDILYDTLNMIDSVLSFANRKHKIEIIKKELIQIGFADKIENMQINHINENIRNLSENIFENYFSLQENVNDCLLGDGCYLNVR